MNKYLFLPFQSSHPISVFSSWITCYIKRIRILCSIDDEFKYNKWTFYARLKKRGYPPKFLKRIFNKKYNREQLLFKYLTKNTDDRHRQSKHIAAIKIPLNEFNQKFLKEIKEILKFPEELREDEHFYDIFGERMAPMTIYETAPNVSQLLIRATLHNNKNT
jgi:hypothetical protein